MNDLKINKVCSQAETRQEIWDRMNYMYRQIDGLMRFPNNYEGDLLKMVYKYMLEIKMEEDGRRKST